MRKIDIIFLVAVVDVGDLTGFSIEELSEFWSAFTVCCNDKDFYAEFSAEEQKDIETALKKVETELRHRRAEPVNFFQLMQTNPARVDFYLSKFSLGQLLTLENDLQDFKKSQIIIDFLKLVKKQIYRRIPVS